MLNMDEEKKLQDPSFNVSAGGQEEDAECGKIIKQRLAYCKMKIPFVISHLIFGGVLFFVGRSMSSNHQNDAINCLSVACPPDWIGYQGHCYNLSRDEKNWMESQNSCILHNASLAKITMEEMDFVMKLIRHQVFWIGLKREPGQPWKWLDGENATLDIGGKGGYCAYLDDDGTANAGTCGNEHRYICKKNIL